MAFRKLLSLLLSVLMAGMFSLSFVFAEEGSEAFVLESSSVVDGDTDISVRPVIELVFSKKIADITVLSANKDRFHLQDSAGAVIPLTVLFPDTQLQRRYTSHAFLTPETDLAPNAAYTLTIDAGIVDKKENALSQSYVIRFTTASDEAFARAAENDDLIALGENVLTYQTALPPAGDAPVTASDSVPAETETTAEDSAVRTVILIAVPVLLALLGFVFYRSLRSSKKDPSTDE